MTTGVVDLDLLLTKVRDPQAYTYFLDAVRAYKAGAYRGAMTSAWVAVAYDLIAKYRELSAMGDAAAASYIAQWDTATADGDTKKLLQLEGGILDNASKQTLVINGIARNHLERLREDRHLCAHPAFSDEAKLFEPSAELVRLHLFNAVDLLLSREPLVGKAILETFDLDLRSPGFPTEQERVLNYVEQRYLGRVREQTIRNFGIVLAKSALKGTPAEWETHQRKVLASLLAVRERAPTAWDPVLVAITGLIDQIEPVHRPRAVAVLATLPGLWDRLQQPTRTALRETVENADPLALEDERLLMGVGIPALRASTEAIIMRLETEGLQKAIAANPIAEMWPRALELYRSSRGWRQSEGNFRTLVAPFADQWSVERGDELLDAIASNSQNWDASETDTLLLGLLENTGPLALPTPEARTHFFEHVRKHDRDLKYEGVFAAFETDGWTPPVPVIADDA